MSAKEERRAAVLNLVLQKHRSPGEAAGMLGLSERQLWRLLRAYRTKGVAAVVHGNRGRLPRCRTPDGVRQQVVALATGPWDGANDCHVTELLAERAGIVLSRPTVRRILRGAGVRSPKKMRRPKHRSRRERCLQAGMLLQIDGSRHAWLEDRGPWLSLVAAMDDATGEVPAAVFRGQEDTQGYFLLLREILQRKGVPRALYSDRHSIFQRLPQDPQRLEEQLAGQRRPTQFGEALQTLGVRLILAQSPQAKGRIERLWGTLQSRLVTELRIAGATTLEEANRVVAEFLPRFNRQFGVPPAQPGSAYRALETSLDLANVLCFKYYRTVAHDNTVTLGEKTIQLLPGQTGASYARRRVEVQERLDGATVVSYQGRLVANQPAPPGPIRLRGRRQRGLPAPDGQEGQLSQLDPTAEGLPTQARPALTTKATPWKPAPNHPWKRAVLTTSLNIYH